MWNNFIFHSKTYLYHFEDYYLQIIWEAGPRREEETICKCFKGNKNIYFKINYIKLYWLNSKSTAYPFDTTF